MAPRDATSLVAVHRELRRRCTTTSPTLERFFAATKQSMAARFDRLAEIGGAEIVSGEFRDRAHLWRVQRDMAFVVCVSVKRDGILAQVLDMAYLPVGDAVENDANWEMGEGEAGESEVGERLVDRIVAVVADALESAEVEGASRPDPLRGVDRLGVRERTLGVAIALPTPVFRVRTRKDAEAEWEMRSASRWIMPELRETLEGTNLHALIGRRLRENGLPAQCVSLINDASAAALGSVVDIRMEAKRRPPRDMAVLWLAEGVGGGIISGHRLVTGSAGFAGEIGHLAVRPDGILCRHCGVRGCLETITSTGAIEREIDIAFKSAGVGPSFSWPDHPPLVMVGDELRPHPAYTEAMREAGWWTGIALAQVVNLLNPQLIVLMDQHDEDELIQNLDLPAPIRDEQFKRSLEAALRRNSLDPGYRHVTGQDGAADVFGIQFGVRSNGAQNEIDVSPERALILPMIGAAADLVDTFGESFFNGRITAAHAATPRA